MPKKSIRARARAAGIAPSTLYNRIQRRVHPERLYEEPRSTYQRNQQKYPAEYAAWARIKSACAKKGGPTRAYSWDDFGAFFRDVGPRPSPDHQLRLTAKGRRNRFYSPNTVEWVEIARNPKPKKTPKQITGQLDWLLSANPTPED